MGTPTLVAIPYSPWSHKARWAIDNAGIAYELRAFMPMVSPTALRLRHRSLRGPITAPIWIEGRRALMDSFAIARHVDGKGTGPSLFPAGAGADIDTWNRHSEKCLAAGRALTTAAVVRDPKALRESVPPPLHRLGPLSTVVGQQGARYLSRKYRFSPAEPDAHHAILRDGLEGLRAGLQANGGVFLVGDSLSYADVAMAMILHFISPPADLPVGPHSRPHWHRPALAEAFPDVVAWRDALFAAHRPARPRPAE